MRELFKFATFSWLLATLLRTTSKSLLHVLIYLSLISNISHYLIIVSASNAPRFHLKGHFISQLAGMPKRVKCTHNFRICFLGMFTLFWLPFPSSYFSSIKCPCCSFSSVNCFVDLNFPIWRDIYSGQTTYILINTFFKTFCRIHNLWSQWNRENMTSSKL